MVCASARRRSASLLVYRPGQLHHAQGLHVHHELVKEPLRHRPLLKGVDFQHHPVLTQGVQRRPPPIGQVEGKRRERGVFYAEAEGGVGIGPLEQRVWTGVDWDASQGCAWGDQGLCHVGAVAPAAVGLDAPHVHLDAVDRQERDWIDRRDAGRWSHVCAGEAQHAGNLQGRELDEDEVGGAVKCEAVSRRVKVAEDWEGRLELRGDVKLQLQQCGVPMRQPDGLHGAAVRAKHKRCVPRDPVP